MYSVNSSRVIGLLWGQYLIFNISVGLCSPSTSSWSLVGNFDLGRNYKFYKLSYGAMNDVSSGYVYM